MEYHKKVLYASLISMVVQFIQISAAVKFPTSAIVAIPIITSVVLYILMNYYMYKDIVEQKKSIFYILIGILFGWLGGLIYYFAFKGSRKK